MVWTMMMMIVQTEAVVLNQHLITKATHTHTTNLPAIVLVSAATCPGALWELKETHGNKNCHGERRKCCAHIAMEKVCNTSGQRVFQLSSMLQSFNEKRKVKISTSYSDDAELKSTHCN